MMSKAVNPEIRAMESWIMQLLNDPDFRASYPNEWHKFNRLMGYPIKVDEEEQRELGSWRRRRRRDFENAEE